MPMLLSGPMSMVKVPSAVSLPVEVNTTENVVSPCKAGARVSTGSTVKVQAFAPVPRVTVILLASTPVGSAQVTVWEECSVM